MLSQQDSSYVLFQFGEKKEADARWKVWRGLAPTETWIANFQIVKKKNDQKSFFIMEKIDFEIFFEVDFWLPTIIL